MRLLQLDMTRRFFRFYEQAKQPGLSMDERWELWRRVVRFVPAPPTPEGLLLARHSFETAWPRYGEALDAILYGGTHVRRTAPTTLSAVMRLLGVHRRILPAVLVVFVGFFDNNAFVSGAGGLQFIAIPAELPEAQRALAMAHEFAHVVYNWKVRMRGSWERTVAETVVSEGLAMHASAALVPGRTTEEYVMEHRPGWWARCQRRRHEVLAGIRQHLADCDSEAVSRFTTGTGPAGLQREASAAGWWVVEHWLRQGFSLADIASWRENTLVQTADKTIGELLRAS